MTAQIIYVFLPEEAVPVWAPMDAEHVHDDIYRILDDRGEDEAQFQAGDLVRCHRRVIEGDISNWVAFELAE